MDNKKILMKNTHGNNMESLNTQEKTFTRDINVQDAYGLDAIRKINSKILYQAKLLLVTDYDDIRSLVFQNLDDEKSRSLQSAFDMLEEYHYEKELAKEAGVPSIRLLKFALAFELLESHEMEKLFDYYISQKKIIKTLHPFPHNTIIDIISFIKPENNIAADGQNADAYYQWTPENKMHSFTEDGKFIIEGEIVNNRLEFLLTPNDVNNDEETDQKYEQLKRGILHWGTFDIEIKFGLGELDFSKIKNDEKEKLREKPLIYTSHISDL